MMIEQALRAIRSCLASAGLLLLPVLAHAQVANVCQTSSNGQPSDSIPDCEVQTMAPVGYGGWESKTWAYYCTGDHPYYWGYAYSGYAGSFNWNQSGFTGLENIWGGSPSSFDGEFTNWNVYGTQLTVNLACSSEAQPDVAGCPTVGNPVADPGCPQSNIHNYCSSAGGIPVCFQTYTESCSSGTSYDCNAQFGVTWCNQCAAGSKPVLSRRATAEKTAALARK